MQNQLILPSKRRVDIHGILVPFDQLLLPGEVLVEGTCTVKVLTGIDPDPSHMLEGDVQVRGTNLYQQIKLGVPGVIYSITFEGTTDLENTYTVETKQAVLEDQIPAGPIYQHTFFTSPPYPLNLFDEVGIESDLVGALTLIPPIDLIEISSDIVSGSFRYILIQYTGYEPEGVEIESDIVSGDFRYPLIAYTIPPEGVNIESDIVSGNLRPALITYSNYPPEGVNIISDIVSGTLE